MYISFCGIYIKEKAENGCAESLFQLGEYYEFQGFYANATELLGKAAHHGHTTAQSRIYTFYQDKNNYTQSTYWLEKLAQDNKDKQVDLGILYYQGKEYDKAIFWLKKAIVQEVAPLGDYCYYSPSKEGLLYEVIYWLQEIAEKESNQKAISILLQLYRENISYIQEYDEYINWLEKLAEKGNRDACFNLAQHYYQEHQWETSVQWMEKWAKTGDSDDILYVVK